MLKRILMAPHLLAKATRPPFRDGRGHPTNFSLADHVNHSKAANAPIYKPALDSDMAKIV